MPSARRSPRLRERTSELAKVLLEKNPGVLKAAKHAYRRVLDMSWEDAEDYLFAKIDQSRFLDPTQGRERGMIAVGTLITERPPHRTVQAAFPHTAPTLGV
jgi:trans-feruloyl-CoA hydratase/vanillin synthase